MKETEKTMKETEKIRPVHELDQLYLDISSGKREPETEREKRIYDEIQEIKADGRIVYIPGID